VENNAKKSGVKWIVIVIVILAVITGWLLFKEGLIPGLGEKDDRVSVLFITVDGLRMDRLGFEGFDPDVTPAINKLVKEGTLLRQCTTPAPISLPAMASLLTGTDPYVHGVRFRGPAPMPLGDGHATLAEIFSDNGYHAAARMTAPTLYKEYGLDQGIWATDFVDPEHQISPVPGAGPQGMQPQQPPARTRFDAREVANSAITWLRTNSERSFYFWVHFSDTSAPNIPPEPYFSRHANDPYMGDLEFVDEQLGRVLAEVEHLGIKEKTLIVLASSFAESLGSHNEGTHSWFLYDSTTRVPVVFRQPGRVPTGTRIDAQTRLIDVAPTILDLIGMEPKPDAQGTSLVPLIDGQSKDLELAAFSETLVPFIELQYFPLRSLRKGGWKYIHAPTPELYDLGADPGETVNLAGEQPDRAAVMRGELFTLLTGSPTLPEIDFSDPSQIASPDGGINEAAILQYAGADPKDHVLEIQHFALGQLLLSAREKDMALEQFLKVLEMDPDLIKPLQLVIQLMKSEDLVPYLQNYIELRPDLHFVRYTLADILEEQGDTKAAIEQIEWIVQATAGQEEAQKDLNLRLADLYFADGRLAEAEKRYRTALEGMPAGQPDAKQIHINLIRVLTDAGDIDGAAEEFKSALRPPPEGKEPPPAHEIHNALGKNLAGQKHSDQAIPHFRKAVELAPDQARYQLDLGVALGQKGDFEACIVSFLEARKSWPEDHDVAFNLAGAYKRTGQYAEAVAVLKEDIEHHPERPDSLYLAALILATCPEDSVRSGDEALAFAQKACELTQNQNAIALQALAAAYAEKGLFKEAEEKAIQAAQLAMAKGQKHLANIIRGIWVRYYKNGKPYRERRPGESPEGTVPEPEDSGDGAAEEDAPKESASGGDGS